MAEVGGIEYQVTADVAPLLKSEKQVDAAAGGMERSFKQTEKAVSQFDTTMKQLPASVRSANQQIVASTRSMGNFRNVAQQAGFQLQDVAVQLQGGTSAFQVIGQQGSQFASVFGPGGAVLGAIIAVASALGGALFGSAKEASSSLQDLTDDAIELEDALRSLSLFQLQNELDTITNKVEETRKELERLRSSPDPYRNLVEDISNLEAELSNQELLQDRINNQIDRLITNSDDAADAADNQASSVDSLVGRLQAQAAGITEVDGALTKSARAQALYIANTNNATAAQIADINAAFDRIEAYEQEQEQLKEVARLRREAAQKVQAQERADTGTIDQLRQQLATEEELVQQSYEKRLAAIRRQTEAGSKERMELELGAERVKNDQLLEIQRQQIENQKQLEQQAREERQQMELEEIQQRLNVNQETAARLQELANEGANWATTLSSSWTNALVNVGDQFADTFARAIVQGDNLKDVIRGVAQSFLSDMLGSLIKVGARILLNNALASTAQATQAATSAATGAAIASAYAPAAALVSLASFGANAAPAIAGITATTAVAQGSAAIPGLALGGNVEAGGVRRINEQGPEPIIFRDGARTFMQAGSNGAQVVSNSDAQKGGMPNLNVNFNVENKSSGAQFEVQSVDQSQTGLTIQAIISDVNNRGPVFRAFERNSNLTGTTGNG